MFKRFRVMFILFVVLLSGCTLKDMDEAPNLVPLTVDKNSELPAFLLSDGSLIHLETFGVNDGTNVLIVLHGGPGGDYSAYTNLAQLSDQYFIVLWDQRGSGLSERVSDKTLSVQNFIQDLNEIVEYFTPDSQFALLGHSWGGAFAAAYVDAFPDSVNKLILIEPMAMNKSAAKNMGGMELDLSDEDLSRFLEAMDHNIPDSDARGDYMMAISAILDSEDDFGVGEDSNLLPIKRTGYRAWNAIAGELGFIDGNYDYNFTTQFAAFPHQVLLIAGSESYRIGESFQRQNHVQLFADVDFRIVSGAGHYLLFYRPDDTISIIREYLGR
ncbi:alpha/beta hydrolase [Myxococcota bacterium]|nr:alpha/beta hydrolase [Myxococcota bacterium]MBU1380327.1 alpha/beta hydrolase [Myxococcota bacterium]MBU1496339.1 alpha/beta hydrolase [Myxococcota bacterium]